MQRRLRRRIQLAGAAVVVFLPLGACGSSLDHDEIVAAWDSPGSSGVSAQQAAGDGPDDVGPGSTAGDGGSGGPTGAPSASSADPASDPAGPSGAAPSGSGEGTASEAATSGPKAPIVIGTVAALSGPAGTAQAPAVKALQIWVRAINDAGGINGHPVQHYVVDDGSDPARHAAAVKDLVENKHVIAFVDQYASQTHNAARAYIEEKQVPVIGGEASIPLWFESPMYFPQGGSVDAVGPAFKTFARLTDGKRLAVITCSEAEVCRNAGSQAEDAAGQGGYEVVYTGQGSLAQPDFTSECLSMQRAEADIVIAVFDSASVKRIARSCSRQGFEPIYFLGQGIADASFAQMAEFEGSGGPFPTFPFAGTESNPAAKRMFDAYARYAPGVVIEPISSSGWAGAEMFRKAAESVGDTPTSAQLLEGLWAMQGETLGGLVAPRHFTRNGPAQETECIFFMQIKDGRWQAPDGMTPTC